MTKEERFSDFEITRDGMSALRFKGQCLYDNENSIHQTGYLFHLFQTKKGKYVLNIDYKPNARFNDSQQESRQGIVCETKTDVLNALMNYDLDIKRFGDDVYKGEEFKPQYFQKNISNILDLLEIVEEVE
jgi:hypothetical protein